MPQFHQNYLSDPAAVTVQDGERTYTDTPSNFERDSGLTVPSLPEGVTERHYTQGVFHSLKSGPDVLGEGELNKDRRWLLGDKIIAALDKAATAKANRLSAALKERTEVAAAEHSELNKLQQAQNDASVKELNERLQKQFDKEHVEREKARKAELAELNKAEARAAKAK